jgi:hypothetical protein
MKQYRVFCKVKHSHFERIESIGCIEVPSGQKVSFSEDQAIALIEGHSALFFVEDSRGIRADVRVEQRDGRKFLITERDGIKDDNLLYLPGCPAPRHVVPSGSHGTGRPK